MSTHKTVSAFLFTLLLVAYTTAKPSPGSHMRLSLRAPQAIVPAPFGYAAPLVVHNLPLDAATASQRVDIHQRYNAIVPAPVIASPYLTAPHFVAAPSPYYAPNMIVGPVIAPAAQLRYAPPVPVVYPGTRVFIR